MIFWSFLGWTAKFRPANWPPFPAASPFRERVDRVRSHYFKSIRKRDRAGGYTLLEVVGVLLLIGLILSLAEPNLFRAAERNRMRYVGELLRTDLRRVQAEAKAGNNGKVSFTVHGYRFTVGENVITRDYHVNGLTFKVGPADAAAIGSSELSLTADGSGPPTVINWESKHYQGALAVTPEGAVSWRYYEK